MRLGLPFSRRLWWCEVTTYLVVNSLPQKKQRKNFIRPFELSVSLLVLFE